MVQMNATESTKKASVDDGRVLVLNAEVCMHVGPLRGSEVLTAHANAFGSARQTSLGRADTRTALRQSSG